MTLVKCVQRIAWTDRCKRESIRGAFVALVKPLDIVKGLQVHTCSLFFLALGARKNSNGAKKSRMPVARVAKSTVT